MKGQCELIRQYLSAVNWATAENTAYLVYGKCTPEIKNDADWILTQMLMVKDREKRIKLIHNNYYKIYADRYAADEKGDWNLDHDVKLRNILAIIKPEKIWLKNEKYADAWIKKEAGFYIEMDNGKMTEAQLADKIKAHYSDKGSYRVIFFMAHREDKADLEQERLEKLFKIVKSFKGIKGRFLGACYSQFLKDQKVYNHRMEEVSI